MSQSADDIQKTLIKEIMSALVSRDTTIQYARKLVNIIDARIYNLETAKVELILACELKDLEIKQLKEVNELYKRNEEEDSAMLDKMMDQEEDYIKKIDELEKQLSKQAPPQLPSPPLLSAYNALKHAYTGDGTLTYAPPSMATDLGYGNKSEPAKEAKVSENLNKHGFTNIGAADNYLLLASLGDLSDSDTEPKEVTSNKALKPA